MSLAVAESVLAAALLSHPRNAGLTDALAAGAIGEDDVRREARRGLLRLVFLLRVRGLPRSPQWTVLERAAHAADPPGRARRAAAATATVWRGLRALFHDDARAESEFEPEAHRPLRRAQVADAAVREALAEIQRSGLEPRAIAPENLGDLYQRVLARRTRRAAGSYYTPPALVEHLLDSGLQPLIERAREGACRGGPPGEAAARAILRLRVCDPAAGGGAFLVAAARRIAMSAARARVGTQTSPRAQPTDAQLSRATRAAVLRCVVGVELDPVAAEVCGMALWLTAGDASLPLRAARARVRVGNALLGAPAGVLGPGGAAAAHGADRARLAADAWCASFLAPELGVSEADARAIADGSGELSAGARAEVRRVARAHRLMHWHLDTPR